MKTINLDDLFYFLSQEANDVEKVSMEEFKNFINKYITGKSIQYIKKISTVGLVDKYVIKYSDGTEYIFSITNGKQGILGKKGDKGDKGEKGDKGDPGVGADLTLGEVLKNGNEASTSINLNNNFIDAVSSIFGIDKKIELDFSGTGISIKHNTEPLFEIDSEKGCFINSNIKLGNELSLIGKVNEVLIDGKGDGTKFLSDDGLYKPINEDSGLIHKRYIVSVPSVDTQTFVAKNICEGHKINDFKVNITILCGNHAVKVDDYELSYENEVDWLWLTIKNENYINQKFYIDFMYEKNNHPMKSANITIEKDFEDEYTTNDQGKITLNQVWKLVDDEGAEITPVNGFIMVMSENSDTGKIIIDTQEWNTPTKSISYDFSYKSKTDKIDTVWFIGFADNAKQMITSNGALIQNGLIKEENTIKVISPFKDNFHTDSKGKANINCTFKLVNQNEELISPVEGKIKIYEGKLNSPLSDCTLINTVDWTDSLDTVSVSVDFKDPKHILKGKVYYVHISCKNTISTKVYDSCNVYNERIEYDTGGIVNITALPAKSYSNNDGNFVVKQTVALRGKDGSPVSPLNGWLYIYKAELGKPITEATEDVRKAWNQSEEEVKRSDYFVGLSDTEPGFRYYIKAVADNAISQFIDYTDMYNKKSAVEGKIKFLEDWSQNVQSEADGSYIYSQTLEILGANEDIVNPTNGRIEIYEDGELRETKDWIKSPQKFIFEDKFYQSKDIKPNANIEAKVFADNSTSTAEESTLNLTVENTMESSKDCIPHFVETLPSQIITDSGGRFNIEFECVKYNSSSHDVPLDHTDKIKIGYCPYSVRPNLDGFTLIEEIDWTKGKINYSGLFPKDHPLYNEKVFIVIIPIGDRIKVENPIFDYGTLFNHRLGLGNVKITKTIPDEANTDNTGKYDCTIGFRLEQRDGTGLKPVNGKLEIRRGIKGSSIEYSDLIETLDWTEIEQDFNYIIQLTKTDLSEYTYFFKACADNCYDNGIYDKINIYNKIIKNIYSFAELIQGENVRKHFSEQYSDIGSPELMEDKDFISYLSSYTVDEFYSNTKTNYSLNLNPDNGDVLYVLTKSSEAGGYIVLHSMWKLNNEWVDHVSEMSRSQMDSSSGALSSVALFILFIKKEK